MCHEIALLKLLPFLAWVHWALITSSALCIKHRNIVLRIIYFREWKRAGIIMCMRPANERWRYSVTPSLIGWAHIKNYPWRVDLYEWRSTLPVLPHPKSLTNTRFIQNLLKFPPWLTCIVDNILESTNRMSTSYNDVNGARACHGGKQWNKISSDLDQKAICCLHDYHTCVWFYCSGRRRKIYC